MVNQIAAIISPIVGTGASGDAFRPQFNDIMQAGESWSSSLADLPYIGPLLPDDNFVQIDIIQGAIRRLGQSNLGVAICYVQADSARIDAADALAAYHIFWRWTINRAEKPSNDTEKSPFKQPVGAELNQLRNYLSDITGKSNATVVQWFARHFETTSGNAISWAVARPRYQTLTKLAQGFFDWANETELIT